MEELPSRIELFFQHTEPQYATVKCHGCGELLMMQENLNFETIIRTYIIYCEKHKDCQVSDSEQLKL